MKHLASLALLAGLASCAPLAYRTYDPRPRPLPRADVGAEVAELVDELAERAELRTPLGSMRVVVDELVPLGARARGLVGGVPERQAVRDTQATLRNELEMSLADRMNVVGGTVMSAPVPRTLEERAASANATHAVVGTFEREGGDVELVVQLVDLRSEWLVATARRRIQRFEPDAFGAPVPEPLATIETVVEAPEPVDPESVDPRPVDPGPIRSDPAGDGALTPELAAGIPDEVVFDKGPAAARLRAIDPAFVGIEGAPPTADGTGAAPVPTVAPDGPKLPD